MNFHPSAWKSIARIARPRSAPDELPPRCVEIHRAGRSGAGAVVLVLGRGGGLQLTRYAAGAAEHRPPVVVEAIAPHRPAALHPAAAVVVVGDRVEDRGADAADDDAGQGGGDQGTEAERAVAALLVAPPAEPAPPGSGRRGGGCRGDRRGRARSPGLGSRGGGSGG